MARAATLQFKEGLSDGRNPFPALTTLVKDFFLENLSPRRRLLRTMQEYELKRQSRQAAECAIRLKDYTSAFALYDSASRQGDSKASLDAAHMAESQHDYSRALRYRLRGRDLIMAGFDAAALGDLKLRDRYWKQVYQGER